MALLTVREFKGAPGPLTGAHIVEPIIGDERPKAAAEGLANSPCQRCGKPVGVNQYFHTVNGRQYHAACTLTV